jgi:heavy metal sensor kinase
MSAVHQSLRWRLQAWHGLILLVVLVAFAVTAFHLVRDNHFKQIDAELQRRLGLVLAGIGPRPRGTPPGAGSVVSFRLSAEHQALFADDKPDSFYYIVWLAGGEVTHTSSNAPPAVPLPDLKTLSTNPTFRQRDEYRELIGVAPRYRPYGPRGVGEDSPRGIAVVGCSVATTQAELRHLAWWFSMLGGGVLVFGLVTGWILSARAIQPIRTISATAKTIAAGNLTERINLANTENELGELARVLNETFDRLQAALARQAQFTADASHELRTPAFVILSQAQSALKHERTPEEYREGFEVCHRAAQQMRQTIESLLILARQDAGDSVLKRERCALDEITRAATDLLQPLVRERHVTVHLELLPVTVYGDAGQLQRVVSNLVGNAIDYNRPDGEVTVMLRTQACDALLTVSDNGPGIAAEDLPHIFERFYRADKSRLSADGHSGLGLAICHTIVKAHGGSIEVSSRVNAGTTFTVRLACAKTATGLENPAAVPPGA